MLECKLWQGEKFAICFILIESHFWGFKNFLPVGDVAADDAPASDDFFQNF